MPSLPVFQPRARGRVEPANIDDLIALSEARYGHKLRALKAAVAPPPSYDARAAATAFVPSYTEADDDQASCGSCWDFSGVNVAETALMLSGVLTIGQRLSKEYVLDCLKTGGCNGDDNTTVLDAAKTTGLPLTSAYGPYTAGGGRTGRCKYTSGMQLYKISDWGFADSNGGKGVTAIADIKAAIMAYGLVGCAVAAGNDWNNVGPSATITGRSTGIDHDVALVGWDDNHDNSDGTVGAWIMKNNWGLSWGNQGYAWIKYGADAIGTETVFAKGPNPPPSPTVPIDWSNL